MDVYRYFRGEDKKEALTDGLLVRTSQNSYKFTFMNYFSNKKRMTKMIISYIKIFMSTYSQVLIGVY